MEDSMEIPLKTRNGLKLGGFKTALYVSQLQKTALPTLSAHIFIALSFPICLNP